MREQFKTKKLQKTTTEQQRINAYHFKYTCEDIIHILGESIAYKMGRQNHNCGIYTSRIHYFSYVINSTTVTLTRNRQSQVRLARQFKYNHRS
jgi:hypothetical protein